MTRRILVAGGGTAGHVFPALAVAGELQRLAPDVEPVFIGTKDRLEGRLVPEAGYRLHHIEAVSLPRRPSRAVLELPRRLRDLRRQCLDIIAEEQAVAAVTFGGYVSFPLNWACAKAGLPLVLHEQNAIPGIANRVGARFADRVAVTYAGSAERFPRPETTVVTGNPVRPDFLDLDIDAARARAIETWRLADGQPTLLVFGGSQGAQKLNEAIVATFGRWSTRPGIQILHAAGRGKAAEAEAAWERARASTTGGPLVRCVEFIDDMAAAYAIADVVVCRAGATSIAELTVLGRPALLVPYPHATADHQTANANALERAGGARVVADADLDADAILQVVEPWLADPKALRHARRQSLAFGRRDAATLVAREVLALIDGPPAPSEPPVDAPPEASPDPRPTDPDEGEHP